MANKDLLSRVAKLEQSILKPEPIHIIIKSYCGQSDAEAFDHYRVKRSTQEFTPKEGWQQLKKEFLLGDDKSKFIKFEVMDSVGPNPPKITNAKLKVNYAD